MLPEEASMLYRDHTPGRAGFWTRLAARLAVWLGDRRHADLDLLSTSAHLRRDIGLDPDSIFRK